jgi:PAS domain S-box-containing protein
VKISKKPSARKRIAHERVRKPPAPKPARRPPAAKTRPAGNTPTDKSAIGSERERFFNVLETLPAYLVLLSPDYHVPFANKFFRERFGDSRGRRCYEYLFRRSEPCENCESFRSFKTGAPHRWEWSGPDGCWYDIYDFPFTDPDGSPLIMEMGIDITERKRAGEIQIQNLARFPEENPNPVMRVDREGTILYANRASRLLGGWPAEIGGKIPPEWHALAQQAFAAREKMVADVAAGHQTLLLTIAPMADEGYANLYGIDITERRRKEAELARVNRMLKAISESNQAMMRARNEGDFMEEACRIVVQSCGHAMVWIGMAQQDEGKTVRPVAYSGLDEGYLETLHVTWADSERGRGPTGTAIRTGKISQCRNMRTDPAFAPWCAEALKRGYASSIALPLLGEERAFGAVTIYSREPDSFSDEEVTLLAELADDLSYGIQAIRMRAMRDNLLAQVEEQRWVAQQLADELSAVFASLSEAVLVYDSGGRIRRANAAALKLLGFDPTNLSTAEIATRLNTRMPDGRPLDPEHSPTARALAGTAVSGERYLLNGAGGRELTVVGSAAPLLEDGRLSGAVTVIHDITGEEHLLKGMQRRAAELDAVINSIADGVIIHDANGGILRMNPAAESIMGYSAEDMKVPPAERMTQRVQIESADGQPVTDLGQLPIPSVLRGETVSGRVIGLRHIRTGNFYWVSASAALLRTPDGTVFGAVSTLTDITQRMEAENDLIRIRHELEVQVRERTREVEEANSYNRSLIEANLDPIVTISPDGKIGDVNAATEKVTGFSRGDLIGKDFSDYFTDGEKARAVYKRVFKEGKVSDYELEIRNRDGHVTPVLYNASVYTNENLKLKGIIAAARDITRRRQAERQLRENTRRVEVVAEISHLLAEAGPNYHAVMQRVAELVTDLLGGACLIHLPAEGARLTLAAQHGAPPSAADSGFVPQGLIDKVFQTRQVLSLPGDESASGPIEPSGVMIVPLLLQESALGTLTAARAAPGSAYTPEDLTLIRTIADRIALAITNSHLYIDLKNALAEEQKARQQLVRTEKLAAMGRLLGSVAHELNNPLQTIKNCLYLVQQEAPTVASIQSYIGMASSETERLVHLVAELRELYRPRPENTPSLCDLADILREVRRLMEQPLYEGRVRWEEPGGAKGCIVRGEKERIQQVFINLAVNAIEAMHPDGGTLTVELITSEDSREAGVVFRDTGPGIPPELLGNLFEPFVTTKSSGLGLGLSICYEIAQKHGGRISVENPPGGGAAFTFWIPLASGGRETRKSAG